MEGEFEEGPTSETNVKADETQDGPVDVEKASLTDELSSQDAPPRRIKKVPPPFSYKDHSPLAVAFINRYYHNQDAASTPPPAVQCTRRGMARMKGLPESFPPKDAPFITRCRPFSICLF